MKTKKRKLIISGMIILIFAVSAVFPVNDVNIIFYRALNADEVATVFQGTSFRARMFYSVSQRGGGSAHIALTSNAELFGTPLIGAELDTALNADPGRFGYIVLDGSISYIDMVRISRHPFVYDIDIYFPRFNLRRPGIRREMILPNSSASFFERRPETRYWGW